MAFTNLLNQLRDIVFHDISETEIQDALRRQENRSQPSQEGGRDESRAERKQSKPGHSLRVPLSPSAAAEHHDYQQWSVTPVASLDKFALNDTTNGNRNHFHEGWVRRRNSDLIHIQSKGRQKLWETSCRVQSAYSNDDGSKYRLDWGGVTGR